MCFLKLNKQFRFSHLHYMVMKMCFIPCEWCLHSIHVDISWPSGCVTINDECETACERILQAD